MPMDAVFLHGLTQELTQSLTGARIDKVQQPERDLLLLSVRTQSGNAKLLVHGGVGSARVHFTAGTFENPADVLHASAQASGRRAHYGYFPAGLRAHARARSRRAR